MPELSIIVPVYNVEKYLSRCLDSMLSQTFKEFEVILVDDGSSDSSLEICREYERKDSRVKVIHTENQGAGPARNVGLDNMSSDSEFVAFVDADDWLHPEMYEKMLAAFDEEADISICDFTIVSTGVERHYKAFCPGTDARETISNMFHDRYGGNPWNKVIRKSLIEKARLRFQGYVTGQDLLFIAECFAVCRKAVKVDCPLYFYNLTNTISITASTAKTELREKSYLGVLSDLKNFYSKVGWEDGFDRELSWLVQIIKSKWVLQPAKYDKYHKTWPESRKYTLSNPFLDRKMKLAMWMLDHRINLPLRLASFIMPKKQKAA